MRPTPSSNLLPLVIAAALALNPFVARTQQPDPLTTLRATASLVVVDVVVQDSHGNPIKGLKPTDFTLSEGRTPQTLRAFEEHDAPSTAKIPAMPKLPPGVFTNYAPAPVDAAVNILLLDLLNTPMQDQTYVRNQLLKFLQTAKPGTRIAIFGLTTQLRMLQSFTADPDLLLHAIQSLKAKSSPLLDNPGGAGAPASLADQVSDASGSIDNPSLLTNLYDFEAENKSFQTTSRSLDTLSALNQIARYLTGIPGRKNLLWFSGSFPINIMPDADAKGSAFASLASVETQFRETTNLLTRAQVAVYPIDALGIRTPDATRASAGDSASTGGDGFHAQQGVLAQRSFIYDTFDAHSTMEQIAKDTGGKAFLNTNGLAQAAASAIDNGSNYYTLSYSPSDKAPDGTFRPIQVKLDQSGVKLFYRHGYFAESPASKKSAVAAPTPKNLIAASVFGAPPATQIILNAAIQPASTQPEPRPAEGNTVLLNKDGPWIRYTVNIAADTRRMSFTPGPNDHLHDTIQCITMLYTLDGKLVNSVVSTTQADVSPADYLKLLRGGLHVTQQISVPAKGNFAFRILVRDAGGDRVGSVEIPVAAVRNLPLPPTR